MNEGRISAARLDRLYISKNMKNRVVRTNIVPTPFTDHKLITVDCTLISKRSRSAYWHINVILLQDKKFCEIFNFFGKHGKLRKIYTEILHFGGK